MVTDEVYPVRVVLENSKVGTVSDCESIDHRVVAYIDDNKVVEEAIYNNFLLRCSHIDDRLTGKTGCNRSDGLVVHSCTHYYCVSRLKGSVCLVQSAPGLIGRPGILIIPLRGDNKC
jgi:hypothetical protein